MDRKDTQDRLYDIYLNITEQSRLDTIRQLEDLTRELKGVHSNKDFYSITTPEEDEISLYYVNGKVGIDITDKDLDTAIVQLELDRAILIRDMFTEVIRHTEAKNAE